MRVRHRIPSIFNLSMVDVLCCALGCVILLWLINLREARQHEELAAVEQREITAQLTSIQTERDKALQVLLRLETQIKAAEKDKTVLQSSLSQKQDELKQANLRIASLDSNVRERIKREEAETARAEESERKLKDAVARVASLEKAVQASEKRGDREMARGQELSEELATARKQLKELQALARLVPDLRSDLKEAREQYANEKALATALEKEIAKRLRDLKDADRNLDNLQSTRRSLERDLESRDRELALARRSLASLREQNKTLEGETARVRAAADNRFAGITLTGRRVLFLVDMSGSMELVDEHTKAPTKWSDVRNTVVQLMQSLPNLEKYQVIVFAEKPAFLYPGEEDWITYEAASSPERVHAALAKTTPAGGTNMYAALHMAFGLRARGLDTIYLLSDGLPNLGEGVTPDALNSLKEVERNDILARHIRKTLQSDWNRPLSGRPRVRINTIGFFYESPDVGAFLWALARENEGSFVGMSKP